MQHLESLFERALDAVVGMDDEGRVNAWNGAAEDIFGWSRAETMGANMGDLIVPPQHREGHANGLIHYNRTGEGPVLEKKVRITALHRDGTEFPVELSIFPMETDNGSRCFFAFIRSMAADEAHRRENEMRRREAEILLHIAQKLLEDVSLDEFIKFCLDEVCSVAGLDAGHLFVVRGASAERVLLPTGVWFIRDERFQPVIEATQICRFAMAEGLPGRAWQTGDLVVQQVISQDSNFIRRQTFCDVGLTRGMALPVHHGGEIHAVLEFFGTEASRFDQEILRLVRTVGSQIGIAIRRKEAAEHRETLRREVAHRVGNSLAVVTAIFRSCARKATSIDDLSDAFMNRVMAIGRANRLSLEDAQAGVPLSALIRDAIGLLPEAATIPVTAPDIIIESDCVMPLSLILNELATNGLKYGGLGGDAQLSIEAGICNLTGDLQLQWHERLAARRTDPPAQPERVGFGSQLLKMMIEGRLGGRHERQIDERGFRFDLWVPLARIDGSGAS